MKFIDPTTCKFCCSISRNLTYLFAFSVNFSGLEDTGFNTSGQGVAVANETDRDDAFL
jgi:hypothetical protein